MGYQLPVTIGETIKRLQSHDLVLPAIQREFVWQDHQIETLFDSLMRGYPIGSFLSWAVEKETAKKFRFYDFIKDYHEWTNPHCKVLDLANDQGASAILDGQQRLTALNVGLRGSFADRTPGAWRFRPASYPVRRLYLNVLSHAAENEDGRVYDFRLLSDAQREASLLSDAQRVASSGGDPEVNWFPVHLCYDLEIDELMDEIAERGFGNTRTASRMTVQLWKAIHASPTLYFYDEDDQDVERVLDIFIRVNSGGTQLSYSDLLLSIATAQWKERDARKEIHGLVDTLNNTLPGFHFSKDVILKTGLVLAGVSDFAFKVKNFNTENMAALEKQWDEITATLTTAVNLLADFGLSDATLTADSVLIPLALYIHHRGLSDSYREQPKHAQDRSLVRSWVLRSLIKSGVWGSGLDSLLRDLRDVIERDGADGFPISQMESKMASRGKSLVLGDEEIEDLLDLRYGRSGTFAVLAILFPHVNTRNVHHIDHVFPRALLNANSLKAANFTTQEIDALQDKRDRLPNLQLLEGLVNMDKSARDPHSWLVDNYPEDQVKAHLERHAIPWMPSTVAEFDDFFDARRRALASHIRRILGSAALPSGEPVAHAEVEVGGERMIAP